MHKGILFILLSGACFFVVNFFVKILGPGQNELFGELQSYPAHELVLARSLVSIALSLFVIKRRKIPVFGNNKKWLIIRGFSGTIALTIFFYTLHYLPLALAATIQYLSPIFTVILAIILLKEKVYTLQWIFIGVSFLGVGIIGISKVFDSGQNLEEISFFWLLLGIISAAFSGLAYTAIMKLKTTDKPITIVFYFPLIAIPFMTILCLFHSFTIPNGIEWLFLLIIGVFTQLAQILLTKALHEGSASLIMPFQYVVAIYAFVIGYSVFNEKLSFIINIGIALILFGVIINVILRRRKLENVKFNLRHGKH
jgi:drug/metabolite transporter (DMT)-like permease